MDKAGRQDEGKEGGGGWAPLAAAQLPALCLTWGCLQRGTWPFCWSEEFSVLGFCTIAQSFKPSYQPSFAALKSEDTLFSLSLPLALLNLGPLESCLQCFSREELSTCYYMNNKLWSSIAW